MSAATWACHRCHAVEPWANVGRPPHICEPERIAAAVAEQFEVARQSAATVRGALVPSHVDADGREVPRV